MASKRKVKFHGAFSSKQKAESKKHQCGGFIRKISVRGQTRYAVMTKE